VFVRSDSHGGRLRDVNGDYADADARADRYRTLAENYRAIRLVRRSAASISRRKIRRQDDQRRGRAKLRITASGIVLQFQGANESALSLERFSGIVRSGDRKSPATCYQEQRESGQSK